MSLTAEQQESLLVFKNQLTEARLYTPATEDTAASHDDVTLLRFLRTKSFDPTQAQKLFAGSESWRKKYDIDGVFAKCDADKFENMKRFYPRWTGRRDKEGRPVYVYRLAAMDSKRQKELYAVPSEQRIIALFEHLNRFVLPLCSSVPHTGQDAPSSSTSNELAPLSSMTMITDFDGVSLMTIWGLRGHLTDLCKAVVAQYPDTMHFVGVVNAPSFFPKIWSWFSALLDENTRSKIHFLEKDFKPVLLEHIDKKDLPTQFGGDLVWSYDDEPDVDDEVKKSLREGVLPKGPTMFKDGTVGKQ